MDEKEAEARPLMGTIFLASYWASEASPTMGCSIEISRDWANSFITRIQQQLMHLFSSTRYLFVLHLQNKQMDLFYWALNGEGGR